MLTYKQCVNLNTGQNFEYSETMFTLIIVLTKKVQFSTLLLNQDFSVSKPPRFLRILNFLILKYLHKPYHLG